MGLVLNIAARHADDALTKRTAGVSRWRATSAQRRAERRAEIIAQLRTDPILRAYYIASLIRTSSVSLAILLMGATTSMVQISVRHSLITSFLPNWFSNATAIAAWLVFVGALLSVSRSWTT